MRVAVFAERDNDGDLRLQQPEVYGGGLWAMGYGLWPTVCPCLCVIVSESDASTDAAFFPVWSPSSLPTSHHSSDLFLCF